jgi:hypothetical protein
LRRKERMEQQKTMNSERKRGRLKRSTYFTSDRSIAIKTGCSSGNI